MIDVPDFARRRLMSERLQSWECGQAAISATIGVSCHSKLIHWFGNSIDKEGVRQATHALKGLQP
jgi:hypothetical protein